MKIRLSERNVLFLVL